MANTAQEAYDAIKKLEAQGQLPLPQPKKTVLVGSLNAGTGKFRYSVPTIDIGTTEIINGKPVRLHETAGKVTAGAVIDLSLEFTLTGKAQGPLTVAGLGNTVVASPGHSTVTVDVGNAGIPVLGGKNSSDSDFTVTVSAGNASATITLRIVRLPLIGAGAFTLSAVPIALIYAPPPGALNKNFAEYSNMHSISTKFSTTVSSANSHKNATAFSTSEFIGKIGGLAGAILAFGDENPSAKTAAKAVNLGLSLLGGLLSDTTTSTTGALTTTTQHDLQTTDTDTSTFGTPPGLGPGVGDRFVYLRNVRLVWVIANNTLSFSVLGDDGIRAFTAQTLLADLNAIRLSSGTVTAGPETGLTAATLQMLLALDPFVGNPQPTLTGPRFVQNDPATFAGAGSDPNGDSFNVSHDITSTDISTQTNVTTTITDYKPGWLSALFLGTQATEDQATLSYSSAQQTSQEQKQVATVTFFSGPSDPPLVVGLFFDRLFQTFAFTRSPIAPIKVPRKPGVAVINAA